MSGRMTVGDFKALPLASSFVSLDFSTGNLYVHEVRRDPASGLTLVAKFPKGEHHGSSTTQDPRA